MNLSLLFSLAALAQDGQVVLPASEVLETLEQAVPQPEAERPPVSWLVPASSLVLKPGPTPVSYTHLTLPTNREV